MSASQALLEREVGHLVLELLGNESVLSLLVSAAEQQAVEALQAIQTVLDDPDCSDFACVEEIVCILERAGIQTDRHDFG